MNVEAALEVLLSSSSINSTASDSRSWSSCDGAGTAVGASMALEMMLLAQPLRLP